MFHFLIARFVSVQRNHLSPLFLSLENLQEILYSYVWTCNIGGGGKEGGMEEELCEMKLK